jgi:hypothetical protein
VLTKEVVAVQIRVVFHLFDPSTSFVINYIQPIISSYVSQSHSWLKEEAYGKPLIQLRDNKPARVNWKIRGQDGHGSYFEIRNLTSTEVVILSRSVS